VSRIIPNLHGKENSNKIVLSKENDKIKSHIESSRPIIEETHIGLYNKNLKNKK
jgi:hypothetical protein